MTDLTDKKRNVKKYLPAVFLVLFTIILMIYFRENHGDFGEIVTKGKDRLIAFYTENLQPLLFGTDITNEDVFNFALYQTLPIDKNENKILKIEEKKDTTFYQVIPSSYKKGTDNYKNFIKYMGFNNEQKVQLDSILNSYRFALTKAVLVNDRNALAVNSRLADLQKAILTDIAVFSRNADRPKLTSLFDGRDFTFLDSLQTSLLVNEIKNDSDKNYLIISKDTAFASQLEFNKNELEKILFELNSKPEQTDKKTAHINVKVLDDSKSKSVSPSALRKYNYSINDSGYAYSYVIPNIELRNTIEREVLDSLRIAFEIIREELNNISFNFDIDSLSRSLKFDMQELRGDTLHNLNFEFNFDKLGEIINKSIESATSGEVDEAYWEKFEREIDSLANEMVKYKEDSVRISQEMKKKLDELKKQKSEKIN